MDETQIIISQMEHIRQAIAESKEIYFRPWVGENYLDGLAGKKVLVLGESHYCGEMQKGGRCFPCCERKNMREDCFSQTEDVLEEFIYDYDGALYQQTFLCFERGVCGKELSQDEREWFWHHVAFYNYLQFAQDGPRQPVSEAEDSSVAFRKVLEILKPDCIIIWGVQKLWNLLPNWDGTQTEVKTDDGDTTPVWNYTIDGKLIPAMAVHHPSTPTGKSWPYWHKFYRKFIGESILPNE